jgi:hypothetical protein
MLLGFFEFTAIEMQTGDIQMPDRLLRKLLVRLVLAKNALEPSKSLAEVATKSRSKRKIVCDHSNVRLVREFFGELKCDSKLLLGFRPTSLNDQTQSSCVRAFQKRFGVGRHQRFSAIEQLKCFGVTAAAPREYRKRVQSLSLARLVPCFMQKFDGGVQ